MQLIFPRGSFSVTERFYYENLEPVSGELHRLPVFNLTVMQGLADATGNARLRAFISEVERLSRMFPVYEHTLENVIQTREHVMRVSFLFEARHFQELQLNPVAPPATLNITPAKPPPAPPKRRMILKKKLKATST